MVGVSFAAALPNANRIPPVPRGHAENVMRVRVTGFARRFVAAAVDGAVLLALSLSVIAVTALALGASLPSLKEIGPDLLVAGGLDRHPLAGGGGGPLPGAPPPDPPLFSGPGGPAHREAAG